MTSDELKHKCDTCRERFSERLGSIEHRLTTVEVTLWGQHGENGLRSDVRIPQEYWCLFLLLGILRRRKPFLRGLAIGTTWQRYK